jgi:hypothetical protein
MKKILIYAAVIIFCFLAGLIWWNYFKVYSDGVRKGTLVKITHKGNVFKTYEGEMYLSCRQVVNVEKFSFSITDKALADTLANLQDQCIEVEYSQYLKTMPWRGDSPYLVKGFKRVSN